MKNCEANQTTCFKSCTPLEFGVLNSQILYSYACPRASSGQGKFFPYLTDADETAWISVSSNFTGDCPV